LIFINNYSLARLLVLTMAGEMAAIWALVGTNDHTLEEVGKVFGVTRGRIASARSKALNTLRYPRHARRLAGIAEAKFRACLSQESTG
jgi:hypothetical protein